MSPNGRRLTLLSWTAVIATAFATAFATACAPAGPRFPSNVVASFARDDMRRLTTEHVELYYPADQRDAALRMVTRLDDCVERLRKLPRSQRQRDKVLTYLTSANFNNAYAYFSVGGSPRQLLLPTHLSLELFEWFNLGLAEIGDISCHEALHYVQMEQIEGAWGIVNFLLGDVFSPNAMMEPWFSEGLATYYEAKLDKVTGRPNSPIWRGTLEAGFAGQGGFRPGDLNGSARHLYPWGGHYLTGSWFVEWLVERYGEDKLWQLIDTQAHSVFSPLWVSLRFKAVYGKTLDALVTEANDALKAKLERRVRPPEQQVHIQNLGYFARVAPMKDGAIAAVLSRVDTPDRLAVFEADGRVRFEVSVTSFKPVRPFISAGPVNITGLSFSERLPNGAEGPSLYVVVDDVDVEGNSDSKLVRFDARTGEYRQHWEGFIGVGGGVSPDGARYVIAEIDRGVSNLAEIDLRTGKRKRLTQYPGGESLAAPRYSPSGEQIVFVRWGGASFDLALWEGGEVRALTRDDVFDYFPSWLPDGRIAFARSEAGRAQIHVIDPAGGAPVRITEAPHLAAEPIPAGTGRVAFLNREGWGWTLDTVPLQARPAPSEEEAATASPLPEAPPRAHTAVTLLSDEPAKPLDHFFLPTLRGLVIAPWLGQGPGPALKLGWYAGAMVKTSDRLGFHNLTLNASYESGLSGPNLELVYGNHQLAPWYLELAAFRNIVGARALVAPSGDIAEFAEVVDMGAVLSASRAFWTTPVGMSLHYFQRTADALSTSPGYRVRFFGPSIGASYGASEGSLHAGSQLGYTLTADASGYVEGLGSSATLADLRATAAVAMPLPGLKVHTLRLSARGRALPGAPADLLRIGGLASAQNLFSQGSSTADPPPGYPLPSGISFSEYLRGYEDHTIVSNGAVLLGARYKLPLIIDRGTPSTFYLLPSFFMRQVDVEAFWDSALTAQGSWHRAAGGAIWLRTVFGSALPVSLVYQFSYRLDDGLGAFHHLALGFE